MTFDHLLTIATRLQSLIKHLIILNVGIVVFVYFLVFDREKYKKNKQSGFVDNKDPGASQVIVYTGKFRNLKIDLAGSSILFSTWSQRFDFRNFQHLKTVTIDPKLLLMNPSMYSLPKQLTASVDEENKTKSKHPKRHFMIVSLQENLLIQRMNNFSNNY